MGTGYWSGQSGPGVQGMPRRVLRVLREGVLTGAVILQTPGGFRKHYHRHFVQVHFQGHPLRNCSVLCRVNDPEKLQGGFMTMPFAMERR